MKKNPKSEIRNPKHGIDIEYVARLANTPFETREKNLLAKQLKEILNYIAKLNEVDTDGVEPIGHITGLVNITRDDIAAPSLSQENALKNASKTHNGFFEVDAIFEEQ